MEWGKLVYLLVIVLIGYLPYKVLQRIRSRGLTDVSPVASLLMAIWFLILSVVLFVQTEGKIIASPPWAVALFFATIVIWFMAPFFMRKLGTYPASLIAEKPMWFVLRFEPKTFYLKYVEVLFQQVKFLYLLFVVFGALTLETQILWFTLLVGFLHLNNLFFLPRREALVFFVLSFPMAVLFSIFILNGYILVTTTIHLWFYLIFAGQHWLVRHHE